MRTSYLDFYKFVLLKVSFDSHLLSKEYHKAMRNLNEVENQELLVWLHEEGLIQQIAPNQPEKDT